MKKIQIYLLCLLLNGIFQTEIRGLDVSVTSASFHHQDQAFLEVYLYVVGQSAVFDSIQGGLGLVASVEFILVIEAADGRIENFDKFILHSPPGEKPADFMALKRFALPNGDYTLKVEATDMHDLMNTFSHVSEVSVNFDPERTELSDIQLLSAIRASDEQSDFTKGGYLLETAPFNFFPAAADLVGIYVEVYNKSMDNYIASYVRYAIYRDNGSGDDELVMQKFRKLNSESFQALVLQMPLDELGSGNYKLIVEIRNRDKLLVDAVSAIFQRSNPLQDIDALENHLPSEYETSFASRLNDEQVRYALKAIAPLTRGFQSTMLEELFLSGDAKARKYFLYNFFYEQLPTEPEFAYKKFMEVANAIDLAYRSNVGYGFETDRGRIFLKYGKPTDVVEVEDEPSAPPYEIWFYDKLEDSSQVNIKFLFYNPSLANNDFILLHSNCNGERNNPRWEVELYSDAPNEQVGQNAGSTRMEDNYRRNARRIWEEL